VATAPRDIALRPAGERWAVPNEAASIAPLVPQLQAVRPGRIVLEAPGGFQRAVVAALPVVVVNPRQARDCAHATGQWAKTDGLDAPALAHCAAAVRPPPRPLPEAQTDDLRARLARRRQLVARRTAETNRLGSAPPRQSPLGRTRSAVPQCPRHGARVCPAPWGSPSPSGPP
jgi:transposase